MIPISECRQYLPPNWSDDEIEKFRDMLTDFIEGILDIVEKSQK